MGSKAFHFKQFTVRQDRCTHKVGTDGVLLGAWVHIYDSDRAILDIGAGSGLIALMLAQRSSPEARIDAVEIEADDVQQALENARESPWPEKINVYHTAVQQFSPEERYDLIVSNPPFFNASLLPPDSRRTLARHTGQLTHRELVNHAARLLSPDGRIAVILPYEEGQKLIALARDQRLFPLRQCTFRSRAHKPPERILIEFHPKPGESRKEELTLYNERNEWTENYKDLTSQFYLKA